MDTLLENGPSGFYVKTPQPFFWIMFICMLLMLLNYILNFQKMPPWEF